MTVLLWLLLMCGGPPMDATPALPPGDPPLPMTDMLAQSTSLLNWMALTPSGIATRTTVSGGRHGGTNGGFL